MRPRVTVREQVHSGTQELVKYHDPLPDLEPGVYELVPVCADCNGTGRGCKCRLDPTPEHSTHYFCPSCSEEACDEATMDALATDSWAEDYDQEDEEAIERVQAALRLTRFSEREDAERVVAAWKGDTDV